MKNKSNTSVNKSTVVTGLNQKILFWQKRLADHLNAKCRNVSPKGLLVLLITFISLMSTILLKLLFSAIQ